MYGYTLNKEKLHLKIIETHIKTLKYLEIKTRMKTIIKAKLKKSDDIKQLQILQNIILYKINLLKNHHSKIHDV